MKHAQSEVEQLQSQLSTMTKQRDDLLAIAERLVRDGLSTSLVKDAKTEIANVKGE